MPNSDARRGERAAYLPPRAAKARKLILRSQLGLPWLLGATLVAGVILVAGVLLLAGGGRPGRPWVRVEKLDALAPGAVTQVGPAGLGNRVVVVDRRAGDLRAFVGPAGACPVAADGRGFARSCSHQSWAADGTPRTPDSQRLTPVPVRLASGDLYVDPGAAGP